MIQEVQATLADESRDDVSKAFRIAAVRPAIERRTQRMLRSSRSSNSSNSNGSNSSNSSSSRSSSRSSSSSCCCCCSARCLAAVVFAKASHTWQRRNHGKLHSSLYVASIKFKAAEANDKAFAEAEVKYDDCHYYY